MFFNKNFMQRLFKLFSLGVFIWSLNSSGGFAQSTPRASAPAQKEGPQCPPTPDYWKSYNDVIYEPVLTGDLESVKKLDKLYHGGDRLGCTDTIDGATLSQAIFSGHKEIIIFTSVRLIIE